MLCHRGPQQPVFGKARRQRRPTQQSRAAPPAGLAACKHRRRRRPLTTAVRDAGMALATLFVTMPFVARELIPILESMDMAQVRKCYALLIGRITGKNPVVLLC